MANATGTTLTTGFGATSTTEDVLSGINLRGKRILVTGVSAGLGIETARSLVAHGANVIGTARDHRNCVALREASYEGGAQTWTDSENYSHRSLL